MQIAIVGCGWLGLPLGLSLQKSGHNIVATCRTEQKAKKLTQLGFSSKVFELGDTLTDSHFAQLFSSQVLVLNIPVGRKTIKVEDFVDKMQGLLKHAADSAIQNVIFISTTSVYGDSQGIFTEHSPTHPQTRSGSINLAVEELVKEYFSDSHTIIRPAGLVGQDRHPARYLAGKTELPNPDSVVNLIHQDDVICAIKTIIEKNIWSKTLHLSALEHPTRKEYYTWAAKRLGLPSPVFMKSVGIGAGIKAGKQIDPSESLNILELTLQYPSPFDMLSQSP